MEKNCIKCIELKDISMFYKNKCRKDGYENLCKECLKIERVCYKSRISLYKKEYWDKNKNKAIQKYQNLSIEEKKVLKIKKNAYYEKYKVTDIFKNKVISEIRKENRKLSHKQKMKTDILYKIKHSIRRMINKSMKNKKFSNELSKSIIGCSFEEFRLHLESKFEPWMLWENYGKYDGTLNYGWDIDHIIPLSSVKNEERLLELNYFKNLQPLCSRVNRDIKRDSIKNPL